jgi:hypothetical protein
MQRITAGEPDLCRVRQLLRQLAAAWGGPFECSTRWLGRQLDLPHNKCWRRLRWLLRQGEIERTAKGGWRRGRGWAAYYRLAPDGAQDGQRQAGLVGGHPDGTDRMVRSNGHADVADGDGGGEIRQG